MQKDWPKILILLVIVISLGFGKCATGSLESTPTPKPDPATSEKKDSGEEEDKKDPLLEESPVPEDEEEDDGEDEDGDPPPLPPDPPPVPDIFTDFQSNVDQVFFGYALTPGGLAKIGVSDLGVADNKIATVLFPGDPDLNFDDKVGPGAHGTHLESHEFFHFGTYRIRFQAAACDLADEGVVTGIFTYWNDGVDENNNGMIDNSEIDIEFLCAEPEWLYMTIWTDYSSGNSFSKTTRKVNLRTGETLETPPNGEGTWSIEPGPTLPISIPNFDSTKQFVELSFIWAPTYIKYFIHYNGEDVELWHYTNAIHIPQHPAYFMMNVWHNSWHWDGSGQADYPSQDALLKVDRFQFFLP